MKYKYKLAAETQKPKYDEAFTSTINAGIQHLAETLSCTAQVGDDGRQEKQAEIRAQAQVVTCLITAAAHRAATRTIKQHKVRNEPCLKPRKRVSVPAAKLWAASGTGRIHVEQDN